MNKKHLKTLSIALLVLAPATALTSKPVLNLSQPYIIYLQKVTKTDVLACRNDANCMDIMPFSDHTTREEQAFIDNMYKRPPYCKTTEEWQDRNFDCIVKNNELPNIYAGFFHDCYDVENKDVLPTDYCLEVGERLGVVKIKKQ